MPYVMFTVVLQEMLSLSYCTTVWVRQYCLKGSIFYFTSKAIFMTIIIVLVILLSVAITIALYYFLLVNNYCYLYFVNNSCYLYIIY